MMETCLMIDQRLELINPRLNGEFCKEGATRCAGLGNLLEEAPNNRDCGARTCEKGKQ